MKTDRRHELQTNVLADWIGKKLQHTQGYSKTILAVLLLVAAAAIAGTFLAKDQAARSQASWNQFFQAFGQRDPEALEIVASANQGTTAAVWAQLAEADLKLDEGVRDLYTNRVNAKQNLAAAEKNYLAVERATTQKLLRDRARFGLGQVYESQGEIEKAKEYYGKLASSSPNSALGKEAKRRADALSDTSTEKWYNWFANQTPRPQAIPGMPGMPGDFDLPNLPSDLGNLPDRPDLSIPGLPAEVPPTEPVSPGSDSSEPGPELNSPAPSSDPIPSEDAATPNEPAPSDAAPKSSEARGEAVPAPSEDAPE